MFSVFTVCFFGHRQLDDFRTVEQRIEQLIDKLLSEHEYIEFLVGRDGEFDQLVTSAILRCKKRLDSANCSVTWVMPYLKSDYIKNRDSYDTYYDSVEVCEQSAKAHPKSAILIRNRVMVDRSDLCVFCVKRFDTQKSQVQISSIFLNDSTFRLQFCISV